MPSVFAGEYDVSKIDLTWNGRLFTGYGDSILSVEQGADVATMFKGVTGRVVFVWSADTSAMVTVTLEHTSDDNVFLEAAAKAKVRATILAKDRALGRVIISGADAIVMRRPNWARAAEVSNNAWVFGVANASSDG